VLPFLKKNWKWIAGGTGILVLALITFLFFRVISFIGDTTGGGRTDSGNFTTPTPDIPATATAQAQMSELFGTATIRATTAAGTTPTPAITITPTPITNFNTSKVVQSIQKGEPVSLLFLGYSGANHDGQWLTDTILIMRYDPKTKTMLQFSVPRDLYVYAPTGGKDNGRWMKVNGILGYVMDWNRPNQDALDPKYRWTDDKKKFDSGVNLVADTLQEVVGFRIDYWATISFEGFRKFIDSMGGVEIDVERAFIDKKYPRNDNAAVDAAVITVEFKAGKQLMNGETAIRYARSRNSETPLEGGDFARSKRQAKVIAAVKEKALKENLVLKSLDYMSALQGNIRFSLDFGELTALANYFNSPDGKALATDVKFSTEVINETLVTDVTLSDVGYALYPKDGKGNYTSIKRYVQSAIANADIRREQIRVQVLNANGTPGLAGKMTDFLVNQGFRLTEENDAPNQETTEIIDYTNGAAPNTIARLKSYLGNLPNLKVTVKNPDQKPQFTPNEVGVHLLLGKDFKGATNPGTGGASGGQTNPTPRSQTDGKAAILPDKRREAA
jgi:LCP family protein required for cell wall assembly